MKKENIVNLIRYYSENNDAGFKDESRKIASEFYESGDIELADYIASLLSSVNTLVPQSTEYKFKFFDSVELDNNRLVLSENILNNINGVMNAIHKNIGVNKFIFYGSPGTGKTEAVKSISKSSSRKLFIANFSALIDSHLGQTAKNIDDLFREINYYPYLDNSIFLFDEIDSLVLDRINSNDVREMGRATSTFLKCLDNLNSDAVIFATTNMYNELDKAVIRRFDTSVNFDEYSKNDLIDIAISIQEELLKKFDYKGRDNRLFSKIISNYCSDLKPGEIKNLLKTAIAFSSPESENDYIRQLFRMVTSGSHESSILALRNKNFTVREIAILLNDSKSSIQRKVSEGE